MALCQQGFWNRMGLAGEGRARGSCLAQSLSAVRRAGPAAQELLPLKQGSEGLFTSWVGAGSQAWGVRAGRAPGR